MFVTTILFILFQHLDRYILVLRFHSYNNMYSIQREIYIYVHPYNNNNNNDNNKCFSKKKKVVIVIVIVIVHLGVVVK
jgi:hypothetical protein